MHHPYLYAKLRSLYISNQNVKSAHLRFRQPESRNIVRYNAHDRKSQDHGYPEAYILSSCVSNVIVFLKERLTLNSVLPFTRLVLCIATIGICSIIATKPYPRSFLVIQPMTSSWSSALIRNVRTVDMLFDMYGREAPYTWRRKK